MHIGQTIHQSVDNLKMHNQPQAEREAWAKLYAFPEANPL